ncbi:GTP-binding protein rhoA [Cytospora mali]|uniref:GTP-binding protein rhoA n=1 Tax=Cytospora mali TaxID=578113 RepID=A0A194VW38_CYTMA|nr:GTP-binding protein rhoA [Valsa mali]
MESQTTSILLLGDEQVGKSTFLSRISQGHSNLNGGTTPITLLKDIDQPFIFEVSFGRRQYRLEFYDTSSPESWRLLRPDLILICFDISHRPSLINLQRIWIKQVRATFQTESTLPLAVLGLKRDLRSEDDPNGTLYPQEAYRVASEMRVDKYMECSAVTGELLQLAFEEICQMAVMTTTAEGGQSDGGCCVM